MNKIHRNVWNTRRNAFVVVAENTRSCGKAGGASSVGGASGALLAAVLLAGGAQAQALATPPPTLASTALPSQPNVVAGAARIATQGSAMTVTQSTERAAINWQSFNIGRDASVQFVQPGAGSVTLNRVTGNEGSVINGALRANGQVFLLNPNGVLFNAGARVDTAGLLASSLNITDADFMAGRASLGKTGTVGGAVINRGTINSADGGYVALIGAQVKNDGIITATLGNVTLAAGNQATLNFNGNSLVGVVLSEGALDSLVANGGAIRADGGQVLLTAKAASGLLDGAVNNTGEVRARTIANHEGRIVLLGDMQSGTTTVAGTLDASAPDGGNGGFIETSAAHVRVVDGARVSTVAARDKTGTWLIDPTDFHISAAAGTLSASGIGASTLETALGAGNVTIQTQSAGSGNGDINVNAPVSWSANQLTLEAHGDINVNAVMSATGTSTLDLKTGYNFNTGSPVFDATKSVRTKIDLASNGTPSFSGRIDIDRTGTGLLTINNEGYRLIGALGVATDAATAGNFSLQGLAHSSNSNGRFALSADINAAATSGWNAGAGFTPIGGAPQFDGTFIGLGHVISSLRIADSLDAMGLFGDLGSGGVVQSVGVSNSVIKGNSSTGTLVGQMFGATVRNSWAAGGTVETLNSSNGIGGLIGQAVNSTVYDSHARVDVASSSDSTNVGGLMGSAAVFGSAATSTITQSSSSGTVSVQADSYNTGGFVGALVDTNVSRSFAIGNVTGNGGMISIAGFVGDAYNSVISDSYARGTVTSGSISFSIGGFAGNVTGGSLSRVYSAGPMVVAGGTWDVGGLVGRRSTTVISNSFFDVTLSGNNNSFGIARTTAQMKDSTTFTGATWDFTPLTGVWVRTNSVNAGYPVFQWSHPLPVLTPVTYTLTPLTGYTYNGTAFGLSSLWTPTSIFGGSYNAWVLGTDYTFQYGGNAVTAFTNAGTYAGLSVNVIKTGFAAAGSGNTTGSFTIDPKALSLTATKVYDGLTALSGAQVAFSGLVNNETLTYTGATANSKNVGTGNFVAAITLANGTNGGLASNYALPTLNAANAIASITAKALSATAAAPNKVYNGTTTAAPTLTITAGLVGSETLNATGTGTFNSKDVATASTVTVNSTALADGSNGGLASNYSLAAGQTAAASITPAAVNASAVAANKVYNGDTTAAVTLTITGGLVGAETLTTTGAATFNTKDVATANTVTVNSTALADGSNGGLGSNYQLTVTNPTGLSATISARPVTVSTYSSAQKVYDGTTALDSNRMALGNLAGGDNVTLSGSGVLADKNVGAHALTGFGSLALDDSNYTLVGATLSGTANVAPLLVEVAAINGASRVYNGSTAVAASLLQINNIVSGDSVALSGSVPMSAKDAGTRTLRSVSGLAIDNSNYTLDEGQVTGSVEVTALPLNISTITGASRVYDTSTSADASLLQATNVFSGDSLTLSGSSVLASKDVGSRAVTGVGSLAVSNSNYTLVGSSLAGAVAISPRPVTVNAYNNAQKVYDGSTALDSNMLALGNLLGDSVAISGSGLLASKDVGNPALTGVGSLALDNSNFTLIGATLGGVAMVTPRIVDIASVNGASRVYDGTTAVDASLLQITNIAAGDSVALSGNATAASKNVGTRAIADLAGLSLDNSNYTLLEATTPAAVVITARPVTVTTYSSAQKVYDGSTALDSDRMALGNLADGDNVTLSGSGVLADKNVGTHALTGFGSLALDDSNYTLVGATLNGTANVAPLLVEVAALDGASRVYNGSTAVAASLLQINNIVSGDSVALSGSVPMSAKDAGTRTLRSMNGLSIDNSNYTLAEGRVTGSVQVTALPLNVSTVTGASRVYDGSTAADSSLLQITNAVAGDAVGLTGSGVLAGRNVGNQAVATGSLALIDANGNYTWTSAPSGTVAVTPRSVTVSAVSGATKVYDRNTDAAANLLSVGGVLSGDTAALTGSATLASARVGNQALGLGSLALSNANYALPTSAPTGTVAITPRTLQITVSVADKVFDGSAQASPSFGDNRITGDQLAVQGSAAFADQNAGSAKPVAMSNLGLSGADAGNYALASNAGQGVTGNLAPKSINYTLTASDPTKRYTASGATLVSTAQLDQLVLQSWAGTVAGTPAGQLSYAIYKAGQPVAEIKEAGVYEIRASFASADAHYAIDTAASQTLTVVVNDDGVVQAIIAQAQRSATLPTLQLASVIAPLFAGEAAARVPNVMTLSVQLAQSFGNGTPLMVLSAPNGDEPSSSVTLEQARRMLASSTGNGTGTPQGGASEGSREVRVPVSRNSLAEIVNGGVKLPTGVDQLLFVVKAQ